MYDDVTYVYDDVMYVYDDVTYVSPLYQDEFAWREAGLLFNCSGTPYAHTSHHHAHTSHHHTHSWPTFQLLRYTLSRNPMLRLNPLPKPYA